MKKLLPAAVLAALAGVNSAQAVHVNPDGLGQVLLYPFYTTEGGQDTYINLVNTTDRFKAVKVRILESMNSQEVLDFNLYLSPQDHWSATITANETGATIQSLDNSCTVPLAISEGEVIAFRNTLYTADSENGLDRTREGYIEVIEMGEVVNDTENWPADILHVDGEPGDCADLDASWAVGGVWRADSTDGIDPAGGGLYGYGVLIDVDEGTDATYDAVAMDGFYDALVTDFHSDPGNTLPSLAQSSLDFDILEGNSVVSGQAAALGQDAISAILMHDTISNDYVLEPSVQAATDWVITFPTKRDYVVGPNAAAPFQSVWDRTTSEACEEFVAVYYDREEGEPTAPPSQNDFSPLPEDPVLENPALCYEANVLSFNSTSNVLKASSRSRTVLSLEDDFVNGWARLDFTVVTDQNGNVIARDTLDANERDGVNLTGNTLEISGLPVIGFAVQKYVNGDVNGLLSNYAGSVNHKATRDIVVN